MYDTTIAGRVRKNLVSAKTKKRGIYVYDRGGDNIEFFRYFIRNDLDFIVRLTSRNVRSWKREFKCEELARQCVMRYRDVIDLDSHGRTARVTLEYGVVQARLPDIPDSLLHMVVVRGFGKRPMMLLTSLAKTTSREALWQVVEGYITRWRVEDTIRFVKQSYNLEDIRLVKYAKLRNRTAIVLIAVYFARTWLGNSEQRQVIASHVARMSLRINKIPEFHFYAIADGIGTGCSRHGKWHGLDTAETQSDELDLFTFFSAGDG